MSFPQAQVGDRLPELAIPMDRTRIVAAAIASQDFEDVHHDPAKAQERGLQDIFISINSTNGLLDRYLTDWAGPSARIHRVGLRLGVPLFPGDTLTLTGEVTAVEDGTVSVAITGSNARGVHVKASASLSDITQQNGATA
jgi:acyl dehydratase